MQVQPDTHRALGPTRRDVLKPVFRHWRAGVSCFVALAAIVALAVSMWPSTYESEMKFLVKRDRSEPLISGERGEMPPQRPEVSDADIHSAVALLENRELLSEVAREAGLLATTQGATPEVKAARAVRALQEDLEVRPLRRTTLIEVKYSSDDPRRSQHVLSTLARLYLEKHLSLHRQPGARQFFGEQAERLRKDLADAEAKLLAFGAEHDVVSAEAERNSTIEKLAEFQAGREGVEAQIADSTRRLAALRRDLAATPERQTTLARTQDSGELVKELTAKVLDLELQRTEMLRKFTPTYPPVVSLEQQLEQARRALASARSTPIRDESTDQNPTHQWLRNEIARVQSEREALRARAAANDSSIEEYQRRARRLDEQTASQQDLIRAVKTAEENYLLYQRRAEEARISDALDEQRIANVTLAEAPAVPVLPSPPKGLMLVAGLAISLLVSLVLTFLLEMLNPRFRSPAEVEAVLELPLLAVIPATALRR
jgi:uncharacterized protein involved in exopolysaccharide biosynthesis